jgi:hypothetical protein
MTCLDTPSRDPRYGDIPLATCPVHPTLHNLPRSNGPDHFRISHIMISRS